MTLSKALEAVSARYVPGTVAYYAKMNPDPWQTAHDELERIAGIMDEATVTPILERFVQRCAKMVEDYVASKAPKSKSVSAADAFALCSNEAVTAHFSRKRKECAKCETKSDLKIVPVRPGSMDVMLMCRSCLATRSA